uniref:Ground-like domain-containing protein n=1 Tax=Steinernema glaseri TaxID=37863 RepID=A0A1I7ZCW9_9BILA
MGVQEVLSISFVLLISHSLATPPPLEPLQIASTARPPLKSRSSQSCYLPCSTPCAPSSGGRQKRAVFYGISEEAKQQLRKKRQAEPKGLEKITVQSTTTLSTCRNAEVQSILRKRISSDVETSMYRIRDNLNAECLSNYLVVCSAKGKAFSYKSRLMSLCSHNNGMVACFVFEM